VQVAIPEDEKGAQHGPKVASVVDWLHGLGLGKYEVIFVREEVDWDTLQWLTEEVYLCHLIGLIHSSSFRFITSAPYVA